MNGHAQKPVRPGSRFLRAAWVYGYAALIMVFGLLRRIERRSKAKPAGVSL